MGEIINFEQNSDFYNKKAFECFQNKDKLNAFKFYYKALEETYKENKKFDYIPLGLLHRDAGNFNVALEYFYASLYTSETFSPGDIHCFIFMTMLDNNEPKEAIKYLNQINVVKYYAENQDKIMSIFSLLKDERSFDLNINNLINKTLNFINEKDFENAYKIISMLKIVAPFEEKVNYLSSEFDDSFSGDIKDLKELPLAFVLKILGKVSDCLLLDKIELEKYLINSDEYNLVDFVCRYVVDDVKTKFLSRVIDINNFKLNSKIVMTLFSSINDVSKKNLLFMLIKSGNFSGSLDIRYNNILKQVFIVDDVSKIIKLNNNLFNAYEDAVVALLDEEKVTRINLNFVMQNILMGLNSESIMLLDNEELMYKVILKLFNRITGYKFTHIKYNYYTDEETLSAIDKFKIDFKIDLNNMILPKNVIVMKKKPS
jgi:hypothetical protein